MTELPKRFRGFMPKPWHFWEVSPFRNARESHAGWRKADTRPENRATTRDHGGGLDTRYEVRTNGRSSINDDKRW